MQNIEKVFENENKNIIIKMIIILIIIMVG